MKPGLKIVISFFILFHWFCVVAWLFPKPSVTKTTMLSLSLPLPKKDKTTGHWTIQKRHIVETYLHNTGLWQDWSMFAPNPLQINRYVNATVVYQDGSEKIFNLPRLSQLNMFEAWIQKRWRKYQHRLIDENGPGFRDDFARYVARKMYTDPNNPPVKIILNQFDAPIPRHDRKQVKGKKNLWVNYTKRLRYKAQYKKIESLQHEVKPEDLK